MSKFCPNCGMEVTEGNKFCNNCGNSINVDSVNVNDSNKSTSASLISERNIATAIILTIVTCGIYGLYWFVIMHNESNTVSDDNSVSGGMALLLSIVTCGIYHIYWSYKMGQKMYDAGKKYNKDIADNSVLYLILSIFGLSIVNYCLIQNDLNKFAK